jgi:hypothetical protein
LRRSVFPVGSVNPTLVMPLAQARDLRIAGDRPLRERLDVMTSGG